MPSHCFCILLHLRLLNWHSDSDKFINRQCSRFEAEQDGPREAYQQGPQQPPDVRPLHPLPVHQGLAGKLLVDGPCPDDEGHSLQIMGIVKSLCNFFLSLAPAYPACPTASSWSSSSPPAALGGGGELLEIITNSLGSPQMISEYSGKHR